DLELEPFYKLHKSRYAIYFKVVSKEELSKMEAEMAKKEAENKALADATVDLIFPGEQQPESDHFIKTKNSNAGVHKGKHWRDATGWFSYEMRNPILEARKLRVMYLGSDNGREFTVKINGIKVADVKLDGSKGGIFFTENYELPKTSQGSEKLVVKFEAAKGSTAGGVYEVRLMK
ncbi:MAG: DUF6805 domain-containing protein, partial [Draconibacterium sp.]